MKRVPEGHTYFWGFGDGKCWSMGDKYDKMISLYYSAGYKKDDFKHAELVTHLKEVKAENKTLL